MLLVRDKLNMDTRVVALADKEPSTVLLSLNTVLSETASDVELEHKYKFIGHNNFLSNRIYLFIYLTGSLEELARRPLGEATVRVRQRRITIHR